MKKGRKLNSTNMNNSKNRIPRRQFNQTMAALALGALVSSCDKKSPRAAHKVLIIAIDAMDHEILSRLMNKGAMPNFSRLAAEGDFRPLMSSIPAQTPVAFSNFITGMNPGGHGIFDFIHRKPGDVILPFLSTSETEPPKRLIHFGKYQLPLSGGNVVLKRYGEAFWQILARNGIPSVIYKIPSNFPPAPSALCREIAGMGAPDMLGTYGTFSYYTDNPPDNASKVTGGKVYTVWVENNIVRAEISGPPNTFLKDQPDATVPFTVYIDPKADAALIEADDNKLLLKVGEWSGWVTISFKLAPFAPDVKGIVKFYLKAARPDFKLYVTPVNISPEHPALPISYPESYAATLSRETGPFYTQGIREDTKALQHKVLDDHEYAEHALHVLEEDKRNFWRLFDCWNEGLLFSYFSSLDLNQHTMWRASDPLSPAYTSALNRDFGDFIEKLYIGMDDLVGRVRAKIDKNATLIVMSDHGFAPFYRMLNLNTWLAENGYMALNNDAAGDKIEFLEGVDWSRTRAYNIGINALYINLRGREVNGIVEPGAEAERLIAELAGKLEALVDEKTGKRPLRKAFISGKVFSGDHVAEAPDIILGYDRGYRTSDESALGGFPKNFFSDNMGTWSGDHCMDPEIVPGILLSNKKIKASFPFIHDLTPSILAEYGIGPSSRMVGKTIW